MDETSVELVDQSSIDSLHKEVALHWQLRHPHIVSVYGSIEDLVRALLLRMQPP